MTAQSVDPSTDGNGAESGDSHPRAAVTVEAAFADLAALRRAVSGGTLKVEQWQQIQVASAAPLPEDLLPEPLQEGHTAPVWPVAVFGGLVGCALMITLARWTAMDYPLVTGGMPIVSAPPIGIVAFEGTALGAVFATVGTVLWRAGLVPGRRTRPFALAEHVSAGQVVVRFEAEADDDLLAALQREAVAVSV